MAITALVLPMWAWWFIVPAVSYIVWLLFCYITEPLPWFYCTACHKYYQEDGTASNFPPAQEPVKEQVCHGCKAVERKGKV